MVNLAPQMNRRASILKYDKSVFVVLALHLYVHFTSILISLIEKYDRNGLRGYKKLYTWSVDLSPEPKRHHMNLIMNPAQAVNDEVLADAIEKWDQDCTNIRLVDPKCVLHDPFRLTAIKNLLSPKCLEQMDTLLNSSLMEDYTKVRAKV